MANWPVPCLGLSGLPQEQLIACFLFPSLVIVCFLFLPLFVERLALPFLDLMVLISLHNSCLLCLLRALLPAPQSLVLPSQGAGAWGLRALGEFFCVPITFSHTQLFFRGE